MSDNETLSERLEALRADLYDKHRFGEGGFAIARAITEFFDSEIVALFQTLPSDARAMIGLAATGSYGRAEMSPYSDIDLLFLHTGADEAALKQAVDTVLYPLWDAGLEVGYSVRTITESLEMAAEDSTALTALLELRPLGSGDVVKKFRKALRQWIEENRPSPVLPRKSESLDGFPDSVVRVLEPDLKSSPGGLRDYHIALWGAQIAFDVKGLDELAASGLIRSAKRIEVRTAVDFLLRIRHDLHFQKKRCQDRLAVQDQVETARRLGYDDATDPELAAALLQDYHHSADAIMQFAKRLIAKAKERFEGKDSSSKISIGHGLAIAGDEIEQEEVNRPIDVYAVLRAALEAGSRECGFSENFTRKVKRLSRILDERVTEERRVKAMFRELLQSERSYPGLRALHEAGFLEVLIPEFGEISGYLPYDLLHQFTVDEHSLLAIYFLEELPRDPSMKDSPPANMARRQTHMELIKLAMICHDIGRSKGPGHADRSARLVPLICHRLGYDESESAEIALLVRHHQLLSRLAQLRDISDPMVVDELCIAVERPATLQALFLVTYADSAAVGPGSWTSWRSDLLFQFYMRARSRLMREDRALHKEDVERLKGRVTVFLDSAKEIEILDDYLSHAPPQNIAYSQPEQIALHVKVLSELNGKPLRAAFYERKGGIYEFVLATGDRLGLLYMVACVLASEGFNVLSAWAFAMPNDKALDYCLAEPSNPAIRVDESLNRRVEEKLTKLLAGRITADEIFAGRKRFFGAPAQSRAGSVIASKVEVLNDASESYTVLEVSGADRLGLLFELTRVIFEEGLNIVLAKVLTETHRAIDAFYLEDPGKGKLKDPVKIARLKRRLYQTVDEF